MEQHGCPQQAQGLAMQLAQVGAVPSGLVNHVQPAVGVAHEQKRGQFQPPFAVSQPQQLFHLGEGNTAVVGHHQLFQQVFGVAQAPVGVAGDQTEGFGINNGAFGAADFVQTVEDSVGRNAPEVEPLAPRHDGGQNPVGLSRAENEHHVGGGLFQGLQESV